MTDYHVIPGLTEVVMLKTYIDLADKPTDVGVFLRLIVYRCWVVISRVRKKIAKQYFKCGHFYMVQADFRRMSSKHSRQALGVGFTCTMNTM